MVSVRGTLGAFVVGAATFIGAHGLSDEKPLPQKQLSTSAGFNEARKLVTDLGSSSYSVRAQASSKLSKMPVTLPFILFILDEHAKGHCTETRVRLESLQKQFNNAFIQKTINGEYQKTILEIVDTMNKNRSADTWKRLSPVIMDIIRHKGITTGGHFNEHTMTTEEQTRSDPKLLEPFSELLLSTSEKDSAALRATATELIISLTKPPVSDHGTLVTFYNKQLKKISKLSEDKPVEIEGELKELRKLHGDPSSTLERELAWAVKSHLEKLVEVNIKAFSDNDPAKQKVAQSNLNSLKSHFNSLQLEDIGNAKNGSLVVARLPKNITNKKELETSIETIRQVTPFSSKDTVYHKNYINWLNNQIESPLIQKSPDSKEIQDMLEFTLMEELRIIAKAAPNWNLQTETIRPLIKTYTKLAKQSNLDSNRLQQNLQAAADFHYFAWYLPQEKLQSELLDLFDVISNDINKLKNQEDKANLRLGISDALPFYDFSYRKKHKDDYVDRLSTFYCKENQPGEFIKLTSALLKSPDNDYVGNVFPPHIMLEFIERNPKYFETNIQSIIETYKKSNDANVKADSKKQLQEVYQLFNRLFNEGHKSSNGHGQLIHHYPVIRLGGAVSTIISLQPDPELAKQILRIETWFNANLKKQIAEVLGK